MKKQKLGALVLGMLLAGIMMTAPTVHARQEKGGPIDLSRVFGQQATAESPEAETPKQDDASTTTFAIMFLSLALLGTSGRQYHNYKESCEQEYGDMVESINVLVTESVHVGSEQFERDLGQITAFEGEISALRRQLGG